jgi:cellulose synthase (UDP-forming)
MSLNQRHQIALAKIGLLDLVAYIVVRAVFLLGYDPNPFETAYSVVFFFGELFLLVQAFGFFLTLWSVAKKELAASSGRQGDPEPDYASLKEYPPVAVIVAARHEPKDVLENTFTTLRNLDYPNLTLYFLDDSSEEKYNREADEIAARFSSVIFRRKERHGAKAGIINDFLKTVKEKYIAVFDADQNPMPDFLKQTVSILEQREKLAFVQTPQFYTNLDAGPVAKGTAIQQAIFYELISEAKASDNAMFCCGTNVVFRREALEKVGGFDETSITEDFSTSFDLHSHGYESCYYNHALAFGMAPENLVAYFKQQIRWATGTTGLFRKLILNLFRNPRGLTARQWWQYFLSGTYYMGGWAVFITMIAPILNLLFNVNPIRGHSSLYLLTFLPFFFISLFLFFYSMKQRNYTFPQIYRGVMLTYISFPIFMVSVLYGLFTRHKKFTVTAKGRREKLPFGMLVPYLALIFLCVAAIAKGVTDMIVYHNGLIAVNVFWVFYYLFIMMHVFYYNSAAPSASTAET